MKYVYIITEECHGLIAVCDSPKLANAMVSDLATAYGYKTKDPYLDFRFIDEQTGGYPEAYWTRWEVNQCRI